MASIISAGTTSGTALNMAGDTSGVLQLATNGSTTAITIDTSQRAAFVAGTAALPAITTTGDTNTGMFFPAADTIAFAEGGAESMRIDSSGNVGIGTSSPNNKLEVAGTIYANNGDVTGSRYAVSQAGVFYNNDKTVSCVTTNVWYNIGFPVTSTSGLFAFRDASRGGSAVFRADTSSGAISISNGITGFEMQWAGGGTGQMQIRVTSGSNVSIKIVCLATNLA
jgi:hypothetical protein